jgi:hypothetical protein
LSALGRAVHRSRTRVGASARVKFLTGLATVTVVALSVILVQPLGAPWWYHADADATYVANSYEMGAGHHTWYLDHPGMPLQDLMAVVFGARYAVYKLGGGSDTREQFLDARLLHLDDSRVYFRTAAGLFYLLGALIAFAVVRSFLRSTLWGTAAGLLWIGAPGLLEQSIQYRPDPLLAALVLLVGFLIVRAAERRDALVFLAAAFALGFTITVKIHAAALAVPLAIAVIARRPSSGWWTQGRDWIGGVVSRFRYVIACTAALWLLLVIVFNSSTLPTTTGAWLYPDGTKTHGEIGRLVLEVVLFFGGYTAAAWFARRQGGRFLRRCFDPFFAAVLWSLLLGIVLPGTLVVRDGLAMGVSVRNGLTGTGVNSSQTVTPFAHSWGNLAHWPLAQFVVLFAIAGIASLIGLWRRQIGPVLWFTGAAVAAFFAAARFGTRHYWAPAFVLSVPPALWLGKQLRAVGLAAGAALLLYVLVPAAQNVRSGEHREAAQIAGSVEWNAAAKQLLGPHEVALGAPYVAPVPDIPFLDLVRLWVEVPPQRTYRFVSGRDQGLLIAAAQRTKVAYYFGGLAYPVTHAETLELIPGRKYVVKPVLAYRRPGFGVLRLIHGDGVDRPYDHPLARFDPKTGRYREGSHYYDLFGNEVSVRKRK